MTARARDVRSVHTVSLSHSRAPPHARDVISLTKRPIVTEGLPNSALFGEGSELHPKPGSAEPLCVLCGRSPRSLRFRVLNLLDGEKRLGSQRSLRTAAEGAEEAVHSLKEFRHVGRGRRGTGKMTYAEAGQHEA